MLLVDGKIQEKIWKFQYTFMYFISTYLCRYRYIYTLIFKEWSGKTYRFWFKIYQRPYMYFLTGSCSHCMWNPKAYTGKAVQIYTVALFSSVCLYHCWSQTPTQAISLWNNPSSWRTLAIWKLELSGLFLCFHLQARLLWYVPFCLC